MEEEPTHIGLEKENTISAGSYPSQESKSCPTLTLTHSETCTYQVVPAIIASMQSSAISSAQSFLDCSKQSQGKGVSCLQQSSEYRIGRCRTEQQYFDSIAIHEEEMGDNDHITICLDKFQNHEVSSVQGPIVKIVSSMRGHSGSCNETPNQRTASNIVSSNVFSAMNPTLEVQKDDTDQVPSTSQENNLEYQCKNVSDIKHYQYPETHNNSCSLSFSFSGSPPGSPPFALSEISKNPSTSVDHMQCSPSLSLRARTPSPSLRVRTPSPSLWMPMPSPSPQMRTPSPSLQVRTSSPSLRVRTRSPFLRVRTPFPSLGMSMPSPSPQMRTPSPSPQMRTPSPSRQTRMPSPLQLPKNAESETTQCMHCRKIFSRKGNLKLHQKLGRCKVLGISCSLCGVYYTKVELQKHLLDIHFPDLKPILLSRLEIDKKHLLKEKHMKTAKRDLSFHEQKRASYKRQVSAKYSTGEISKQILRSRNESDNKGLPGKSLKRPSHFYDYKSSKERFLRYSSLHKDKMGSKEKELGYSVNLKRRLPEEHLAKDTNKPKEYKMHQRQAKYTKKLNKFTVTEVPKQRLLESGYQENDNTRYPMKRKLQSRPRGEPVSCEKCNAQFKLKKYLNQHEKLKRCKFTSYFER